MKKRFTEAQIIDFLREADAGMPIKALCRKHGFSELSFHAWTARMPGVRSDVAVWSWRRLVDPNGVPSPLGPHLWRAWFGAAPSFDRDANVSLMETLFEDCAPYPVAPFKDSSNLHEEVATYLHPATARRKTTAIAGVIVLWTRTEVARHYAVYPLLTDWSRVFRFEATSILRNDACLRTVVIGNLQLDGDARTANAERLRVAIGMPTFELGRGSITAGRDAVVSLAIVAWICGRCEPTRRAGWQPLDGKNEDCAMYWGTVLRVEGMDMPTLEGRGWRLRVRLTDGYRPLPFVELDVVFAASIWPHATPPTTGDVVGGEGWLQGEWLGMA